MSEPEDEAFDPRESLSVNAVRCLAPFYMGANSKCQHNLVVSSVFLNPILSMSLRVKNEDTTSTWDYEGLLESWDGEILVNGTSQYFGVLIFGETVDKVTKEQFTQVGLMVSVRTAVIHNIAIACRAQEVCDYVIEKLT